MLMIFQFILACIGLHALIVANNLRSRREVYTKESMLVEHKTGVLMNTYSDKYKRGEDEGEAGVRYRYYGDYVIEGDEGEKLKVHGNMYDTALQIKQEIVFVKSASTGKWEELKTMKEIDTEINTRLIEGISLLSLVLVITFIIFTI